MSNPEHIYIKFDFDWTIIEKSKSVNTVFKLDALIDEKINQIFNSTFAWEEDENFKINLPNDSKNVFECSIHTIDNFHILTGYNLYRNTLLSEQLENIEIVSDMNMNKLQKVNDLLNEANSIKEVFLSKVSHELRTPLNAVMGFSEVLRNNPNANTSYYINLIDSNARLLHTYVEDLLHFSKSNQSEVSLNLGPVSPKKLVDEITELVKINPEFTSKNIEFISKSNFSDVLILADEVRFRQILINLINNALKFTKEGKVEMILSPDAENKNIEIIISDTGIGISEENVDGIFNEYQQLETLNKHKGLGLGLSIVKSIVELMKGVIKVESKVGIGTTFKITLPLTMASTDLILNGEKASLETQKINNCKILYVEDSITNQKVFQAFLKDESHQIDIASNWDKGFYMHSIGDYDAIFVDTTLGTEDGKTLISKIREIDNYTPIVSLTAHTTAQEKINCYKVGADYFLGKPFTINNLKNALYYCNYINEGFTFSNYIQQFSKQQEFQKSIIRLSLEEMDNNIISLLKNTSHDYKKLIEIFLHKSKTAIYTLGNKNINSIIDALKLIYTGGNVENSVEFRSELYKLKNQIDRFKYSFSEYISK